MEQQTASVAQKIGHLLKTADAETAKKLLPILKKEGILAGCFSQYCKGVFHAHAPTS